MRFTKISIYRFVFILFFSQLMVSCSDRNSSNDNTEVSQIVSDPTNVCTVSPDNHSSALCYRIGDNINQLLNASAYSGYISAQSQATIEEVVVTSRKKSESLQDVPLSVATLGEQNLEEKGINVFEDYLLQLPGVTAGGSGPGNNTIYIRGLASTTPALTTAGVAGLAPNVSFYLDEQPLAQPGRNLDVYAADVSRIEVLSGPQGTLFGASSQAGVVRMITNKPVIGESESSLEVESRFMSEGSHGSKVEYVSNIPMGDSTAMRFVAYRDRKGGYICLLYTSPSPRDRG